MSPSTKMKRSASPSLTHSKRIKKEPSSTFPRTSKVGPIVIDDDSSSDSDDPNDQLSLLRQEVKDINAMIKEAEKRHKVKHGERELAEQELATKHHLEEHAEQEEMLRLQNLQKRAGDRLRRQMRDTIHASRFRPSKIRTAISVQIPARSFKVEEDSDLGEENPGENSKPSSGVSRQANVSDPRSRLSSVSTAGLSLPGPTSTRPTSRSSNEDRSVAKSDHLKKRQGATDRPPRSAPKHQEHSGGSSADEYEWVNGPEDDDGENYVDLDDSEDNDGRNLRTSRRLFRRGSEKSNSDNDSDIVSRPRRRRIRVAEDHSDSGDDSDTKYLAETQSTGRNQCQIGRELKKSRTLSTNAAHGAVVKEECSSSGYSDNAQIVSDAPDSNDERNRSPRSSPSAIRKKKSRTKSSSAVPRIQMPAYILSLNNDYHHKLPLPDTSIKFSRRFLSRFIGGGEQMTFVNISDAKKKTQIYPIDRYAGFHTDWNPQVPYSAGMHGAGLSIGCIDTKSGKPVGVDDDTCSKTGERSLQEQTHYFVYRRDTEWEYCGLYVQGRKFEKLTPEEYKLHVSESVRNLWAEKICVKDWGHGVLVRCGAAETKEDAMKITPDQVRRFMDCPDDKPGIKLRFYWLYMECVDYDLDFYQALAKKGLQVGWTTREDPDKPNRYGLNADMPTALLEGQEDGDLYE